MTRRAVILAGGGIRVAWQTGVVNALHEAGLTFDHGDGTSGGIFTLGMMLSGVTPAEMIERWRAVRVRKFVSPMPIRSYLTAPTNWAALGGSRGIRQHVLPTLGIDVAAIRRAGPMTGTFNVADFGGKRCVAIPHDEVDEDLLIAGVSLAGLMPAVQRDGKTWTDAVWIKDANLTEAVRRGCTELWLLWCIGNNPRWGTGLLEQYVHMIEMSATGGLATELEWLAGVNERRAKGENVFGSTEQVVLHVIKPHLPLPLDPDFVAGRIDAETLIGMGYRDAMAYLRAKSDTGVRYGNATARSVVTATVDRRLGARTVLRATGTLDPGGAATCTLVIEADDLVEFGAVRQCHGVGGLAHPTAGYRAFSRVVVALLGYGSHRRLSAIATLTIDGAEHRLHIAVPLPSLSAARTQQWTLVTEDDTAVASGAGRMSPLQAVRAVLSLEPTGAHRLRDRLRAISLVWRTIRHRTAVVSPCVHTVEHNGSSFRTDKVVPR